MDGANGLQEFGTARRVGNERHLEQKFGVMSAQPTTARIRYFDIQPDRFSWTADRSTDGGKTWDEKFTRIEARRIGCWARFLRRLTGERDGAAAPSERKDRGQSDELALVHGHWASMSAAARSSKATAEGAGHRARIPQLRIEGTEEACVSPGKIRTDICSDGYCRISRRW